LSIFVNSIMKLIGGMNDEVQLTGKRKSR